MGAPACGSPWPGVKRNTGSSLSGMFTWAPMPGAGADSVPITSAPVRPPSGADGVLSGDSAPFLEKSRGPCHRPFWLHRYRHRQYKMSCYRHHTLPRLVSHTDPSLLMGIGAAQSQRADAVPGAGLKRRGALEINARGMAPDVPGVENRGLRQKLRALERDLFSETLRRGRMARGNMVAGNGS